MPSAALARCFDRMKGFLVLATAVCQVEVPDFEGIAHFSVLSLAVKERPGCIDTEIMRGDCAKNTSKSFIALGKLLRTPHDELEKETTLHRPIALDIFKCTRCVYLEAWKVAMARTHRRSENYPCER